MPATMDVSLAFIISELHGDHKLMPGLLEGLDPVFVSAKHKQVSSSVARLRTGANICAIRAVKHHKC